MRDTEVTIDQGDRLLLQCHAPKSFPDRHIYWTKTDAKGSSDSPKTLQSLENAHYSMNAQGDLYFSYAKASDRGTFFCNVENHNLGRYQRRTVELFVNPGTSIFIEDRCS